MSRAPWSDADLALMRAAYPDTHTAELALRLGRSVRSAYQCADRLGLRKSAAYLAGPHAARLRAGVDTGVAHRWVPGQVPWNKGRPGSTGLHDNTRAHHYRPGNISGRAAQLVQPIGTLRINADGVLERKVSDQPGPAHRRWHPVHRLVWEAAHGPAPAGHLVAFRPGRRTTDPDLITPDALELLTRAQNMLRNSYHRYGPEVACAIQLRGALNRNIKRLQQEADQ